jgi:hypothetical protein
MDSPGPLGVDEWLWRLSMATETPLLAWFRSTLHPDPELRPMNLKLVPVEPKPTQPINLRDFVETVELMRRLQRSYFRHRSPDVLQKCKNLEQQVDAACRQYLGTSARDEGQFHLSNDDGDNAA